jgi:hypothetical protein
MDESSNISTPLTPQGDNNKEQNPHIMVGGGELLRLRTESSRRNPPEPEAETFTSILKGQQSSKPGLGIPQRQNRNRNNL